MTNQEILKKVIKKAVNNGLDWSKLFLKDFYRCLADEPAFYLDDERYYGFIFHHDFAKCFWGSDKNFVCHNCGEIVMKGLKGMYCPKCRVIHKHEGITHWQYHLQQMVLEPEPLKYLERFLDKENGKGE